MKSSKIGLVVFWIGVVFMIAMGFVASFSARAAYRHMTLKQVNQTPWALGGPLFGLWASAVPLGAILAGVGVLLHVRAKGGRIWLFGLDVFAVLLADILVKWRVLPKPRHVPGVFSIGGGLIVAAFLPIL